MCINYRSALSMDKTSCRPAESFGQPLYQQEEGKTAFTGLQLFGNGSFA